jgi:hypothetical protein
MSTTIMPDTRRAVVIPEGAGPCQGGFCGVLAGVRACVTGVSCFPDSCHARGERPGGSRTGRSPAAVAAPEASLRRPAGSPMIGRRGTGAGSRAEGFRLFGSVPMSGVIPVRQCRWLQSSLRVSPAVAGGHGAVRVRAGGQAGSFKFAPWPPAAAGQTNLRPRAWPLAGMAGHAAGSAPVTAGCRDRQRICPSRRP